MGTDFDLDGGIMIANSMTTKAGERGRDAGSQGYIIATPSTGDISHCLNGGGMGRQDYETETLISHALTGGGFDASEDGTGRGTPIIAFAQNQRDELREMPVAGALAAEPGMKQQTYIAFSSKDHGADAMDNLAPTLRAGTHSKSHANAGVPPAVTVALRGREGGATAEIGGEQATALRASQGGGDKPHVLAFQTRGSNVDIGDVSGTFGSNADRASGSAPMAFTLHGADKTVSTATQTELAGSIRTKPPGSIENSSTTVAFNGSAVRRLTPRECERLQGFPDDYTLVPFRGKPAADGPRYKALGNSMAVPVMRWLGERIALVHGRCRP
jgi:DNA (cytosine-5)-methyltransferase 1